MNNIQRSTGRKLPGYPSLREHFERKALLGAAVAIGLGAAIGRAGDTPPRLGGDVKAEPRTIQPALKGVMAVDPKGGCSATNAPAATNQVPSSVQSTNKPAASVKPASPGRLMGDVAVEPKRNIR